MKKKLFKVLCILSVMYFLTTGFSSWKKVTVVYNVPNENAITTVNPIVVIENDTDILRPFIGNSFIGFKEAVGFKESQGKYNRINTLGYLGKYQFGKSTFKTIQNL